MQAPYASFLHAVATRFLADLQIILQARQATDCARLQDLDR